jgi:hypothetical protein
MVRHHTVLLAILVTAQLATAAVAAPRHKAKKGHKAKKVKAKKAVAPTPAPVAIDTTAHAYLRAVESNDRVAQGKILAAGRRGYTAGDGSRLMVFPDKSGVRVQRDGTKSFAGADVSAEIKGREPVALASSI